VHVCPPYRRNAEFWSLKPVLLPGDAAAVRAGRLLKQMIETEQASAP
jgi:vanillate O-demethylase monooxygenase subunit